MSALNLNHKKMTNVIIELNTRLLALELFLARLYEVQGELL